MQRTRLIPLLYVLLLPLLSMAAPAEPAAPLSAVGAWKTVDDTTGKEKSIVRIVESGGTYSGRIERLLDPTTKQDAVCEPCPGDRKNQPLIGLQILQGMKADRDEPGLYEGGDVIDPKNGKVYRARLKVVDGGRKLEMRGYLGPFYRTQVWLRAE